MAEAAEAANPGVAEASVARAAEEVVVQDYADRWSVLLQELQK